MTDSPDSHFIVQNRTVTGGENFEQSESNACWCSRI
jgi:hypothetical protein